MDDFGRQLFTSLSLIVQSMMFQEFESNRSMTGLRDAGRAESSKSIEDSNDLQKKFHMSDRQLSIAKMIADGLTNREIAKTLNFSESTARYETIKIYERLQVKNRAQAAAMVRSLIAQLTS
jgi:DNA-binding NarL/FixJ family response regulator